MGCPCGTRTRMRPIRKSEWSRLLPEAPLHPLLPEEEGPEVIMPLQAMEGSRRPEYSGYKRLEVIVDSGAAASVLPRGLLPDYPVTDGEAVKRGVHYLTADGGRVPNLGETRLRLVTRDKTKCTIKFQVAEVQKPILSVGSLAAMGNGVTFTRYGGTITHLKTGRKIAFKKRGGVYILEMLVAPGPLASPPPTVSAASASAVFAVTAPGFTRPGLP